MSEAKEQRKLTAIMFTDMVGYSALVQRNEVLTLELLEEHRRLLRDLFPRFDGREVETTGDGFLVEFASALEAARCAIEIQRALATRNISVSPDRRVQLRIGIHVGDVVHKDGCVLGDGVNIAARLQPLAEPGGICISVDVARQVQHQLQAAVVRVGETALKNIRLPMELFRIVLPWEKQEPQEPELTQVANSAKPIGKLLLGVAAVLVLGLLGAGLVYWAKQGSNQSTAADVHRIPTARPEPSTNLQGIAVLPFANLSSDRENEYFAQQMTEQLTAKLWPISGLRVVLVTSSNYATRELAELGRELKVNAVLRGSISKAGDQINVIATLLDVRGQVLWATNFEKEFKAVFAIQRDVAQGVVEALRVELGAGDRVRIETRPTENLEAYNLYLKAGFFYGKFTQEGMDTAISLANRAVQLAPDFASAYELLAGAYLGSLGFGKTANEVLPKAQAAVEQALRLDPNLVQAHLAMGAVKLHNWQWHEADVSFKRGLALDPKNIDVHDWYASLLNAEGHSAEALREESIALEADPLSSMYSIGLGSCLLYTRQYDKALAQFQETLRLDPGSFQAVLGLGITYGFQGKFGQALAAFDRASQLTTESVTISTARGWVYARSGQRDAAMGILLDLKQEAKLRYVRPDLYLKRVR